MKDLKEKTKTVLCNILETEVLSVFHGDNIYLNLFIETNKGIICISSEEYIFDYDDFHLPTAVFINDRSEAMEIISKEFINPSRCFVESLKGFINDICVIKDYYYCKFKDGNTFEREYFLGFTVKINEKEYVIDIDQSGIGVIRLVDKETYLNDSQYDMEYIDDPNFPNPDIVEEKYERIFLSLKSNGYFIS